MRNYKLLMASLTAVILFASLAGSASAAPLAQATGQICVQAFDDVNRNEVFDPDEKLLSGVGFTLSDDSGVRSSYETTTVEEVYCFGNLPPGSYTVRAKAPVGYESTTVGQWVYPLAAGGQYEPKYGATKIGGAAPANNSSGGNTGAPAANTSGSSSSGTSTLGRVLLGGLGVIILLVAGFMAGMFVQRSRANRL